MRTAFLGFLYSRLIHLISLFASLAGISQPPLSYWFGNLFLSVSLSFFFQFFWGGEEVRGYDFWNFIFSLRWFYGKELWKLKWRLDGFFSVIILSSSDDLIKSSSRVFSGVSGLMCTGHPFLSHGNISTPQPHKFPMLCFQTKMITKMCGSSFLSC